MYSLREATLAMLVWSLCVGSAMAKYGGLDIFVQHGMNRTSYVSRLVAAMPWTAFTAMCALVGGHMLSIKTWASQRDRGVSTVARDFSMSTGALTTDLNDLKERWTKRGVLGWAARQTVFLLLHSGAILYNFTPGPLVDTFGGAVVDFLFACLMSAIVLHVQGEITLKRRKTYAAACFHGCAILLTMTFGFIYFDLNHQPVVNALAVAVVRAVMHGDLIEFKITVICCFVEMKRVSTWIYNAAVYLPRFKAVARVIVPESQVNDDDDDDDDDAGASISSVVIGGVVGGGDGRITFSSNTLDRLATQGRVGENKAREIVWDSEQSKKDVAHAISLKGSLPPWLQPETFSQAGLLRALNTKYAKCERRAALLLQESPQTDLVVRASGRRALVFRLREPRLNVKLAPLIVVDDVPNYVPEMHSMDAARFLAHYCCIRTTSMFLLLALVHAMREDYDSELPPCISGGCWELDRFRFSEREVKDLPDFVRRYKQFIDVWWPAVSKSNGVRAATRRLFERKRRGCDVLRVDDVAPRLRGGAALRRRACWSRGNCATRKEDRARDGPSTPIGTVTWMYAQVARPHHRPPLRGGLVPSERC
jgi:hypothetical protein